MGLRLVSTPDVQRIFCKNDEFHLNFGGDPAHFRGAASVQKPIRPRFGSMFHLPANTPIPKGLALINDRAMHWLWVPSREMPLEQYRELLREVSHMPTWQRMTDAPEPPLFDHINPNSLGCASIAEAIRNHIKFMSCSLDLIDADTLTEDDETEITGKLNDIVDMEVTLDCIIKNGAVAAGFPIRIDTKLDKDTNKRASKNNGGQQSVLGVGIGARHISAAEDSRAVPLLLSHWPLNMEMEPQPSTPLYHTFVEALSRHIQLLSERLRAIQDSVQSAQQLSENSEANSILNDISDLQALVKDHSSAETKVSVVGRHAAWTRHL